MDPALRGLASDRIALRQLRAGWSGLIPGAPPQGLDRVDLVSRLRRELRGGRVTAALLDPGAVPPPAPEPKAPPATGTFAFIRLGGLDIAVAQPGRLPGPLQPFRDRGAAASQLAGLPLIDPALVQLRIQAATLGLPPAGKVGLVREIVVHRLRQGSLDGAVMHRPAHRTMAARVAPAPLDIGTLDTLDRIKEGVLRAEPFIRQDIAEAYAELTKPENLAIMAAVFAGLMAAQAWPPAGIAIDAAVFITAAFTIGWKSVDLFKGLVAAVTAAVEAKSEADLDLAGRHFADAFEALGAVALAALTARFSGKKFGKWMEEKQGVSAGRAASTRPKPAPVEAKAKPSPAPEQGSKAQLPLSAKDKLKAVLDAKKGNKPLPSEYLSQEYIEAHLAEFKEGSVYKVIKGPPRAGTFGDDSVFVLPKSEVEAALTKSGGDPRQLEVLLGMDKGYLGDSPYLLEFKQPANLRMATGNEANAWEGLWEPGGYTKGGIKEAVIDGRINPSDFVATPIKKGP